MKIYRSASLRDTLGNDQMFWKRVLHRGENLYESEKRRADNDKLINPLPDLN